VSRGGSERDGSDKYRGQQQRRGFLRSEIRTAALTEVRTRSSNALRRGGSSSPVRFGLTVGGGAPRSRLCRVARKLST
jgi:hypothetical protein